ncbi:MAG: hypothetical protein VXW87_00520 [Pseudomonadota bacterium]|nr:hypothetical protein [Pseudomonadota bacterium]
MTGIEITLMVIIYSVLICYLARSLWSEVSSVQQPNSHSPETSTNFATSSAGSDKLYDAKKSAEFIEDLSSTAPAVPA